MRGPRKEGELYQSELPNTKLEIISIDSWQIVEERLRQVVLLGDKSSHPYQNARLSLQTVCPEEILPLAMYALLPQITFITSLYENLRHFRIDILNLDQAITSLDYTWGKQGRLAPPLIEIRDGRLLLVDGLHRVYLAQLLGLETISVVIADGVKTPLPCLPVSWGDLILTDTVPSANLKRRFVTGNPQADYKLFRVLDDYVFYR